MKDKATGELMTTFEVQQDEANKPKESDEKQEADLAATFVRALDSNDPKLMQQALEAAEAHPEFAEGALTKFKERIEARDPNHLNFVRFDITEDDFLRTRVSFTLNHKLFMGENAMVTSVRFSTGDDPLVVLSNVRDGGEVTLPSVEAAMRPFRLSGTK